MLVKDIIKHLETLPDYAKIYVLMYGTPDFWDVSHNKFSYIKQIDEIFCHYHVSSGTFFDFNFHSSINMFSGWHCHELLAYFKKMPEDAYCDGFDQIYKNVICYKTSYMCEARKFDNDLKIGIQKMLEHDYKEFLV